MKEKELLEEAISFIVEREEKDDFICEQMVHEEPQWCENNCQNLWSECVIRYLKVRINNKENGQD